MNDEHFFADPGLRALYPFESQSHYLRLSNGHLLHYLDQNCGPDDGTSCGPNDRVIFLLHGNPTWSFFFREIFKMATELHSSNVRLRLRLIAPDHLGMGLSDKPQCANYTYSLSNHIQNLVELKEHLGIQRFSLVMHDWGGAIGMGLAQRYYQQVERLVLMNTAAFCSYDIPWRIFLGKIPYLGELVIRGFNAFSWAATWMAVNKKLSPTVRKGFLFPYQNYQQRVAVAQFVKDIPLHRWHPSYVQLKYIETGLELFAGKQVAKLFLWGAKDFCFHLGFLRRWQTIWRENECGSETVIYPDAGHYLLEDAYPAVQKKILDFLSATEANSATS
ncbi:MAG: alpha/beta fold hydrolase [Oligoflexia bacterium]|nr:alpha/beta fold hydrolase [Oligoflexia bacterium]